MLEVEGLTYNLIVGIWLEENRFWGNAQELIDFKY